MPQMPVNVMIGILALLIALVLYSMGAVGAFRAKALTQKSLRFLWIGLFFDVLATVMMGISSGGLDLSAEGRMHTFIALAALFGILAVAVTGALAFKKKDEKTIANLSKWVLGPYALWVFVFIWGMIARAPRG